MLAELQPPLFPCAFLVIRGRMHWGTGDSCCGLAETRPGRQGDLDFFNWACLKGKSRKSDAHSFILRHTVHGCQENCVLGKNLSSHHLNWIPLAQLAVLPKHKATRSDRHVKMGLKRTLRHCLQGPAYHQYPPIEK